MIIARYIATQTICNDIGTDNTDRFAEVILMAIALSSVVTATTTTTFMLQNNPPGMSKDSKHGMTKNDVQLPGLPLSS